MPKEFLQQINLKLLLPVLFCCAVSIQLNGENIALFFDSDFVDTEENECSAEATNHYDYLTAQGHAVSKFTGLSAADLSAALAGQAVLYLPEFEGDDPNPVMDAASRAVINNFVNAGGLLIIHGSFDDPFDADFLNNVFGFSLTHGGDVSSGTGTLNVAQSAGTVFDGAAATIALNNGTNLLTASFPPTKKCIYERNAGETVVGLIPFGSGNIVYLGWDYFEGGPGCEQEDADWNDLINRAMDLALFVYVIPDPQIPTMSEWGLLIFGLVVLNFSIFFIRRKEEIIA